MDTNKKRLSNATSLLKRLNAWTKQACQTDFENPCDPELMSEINCMIIRAILDKDDELLKLLKHGLNPFSSDLADKLIQTKVKDAIVQAAEIGELSAMVETTILMLEQLRPEDAINRISHGKDVLKAMQKFGKEATLDDIIQNLRQEGIILRESDTSKTLTSLEFVGFIRQIPLKGKGLFTILPLGKKILSK